MADEVTDSSNREQLVGEQIAQLTQSTLLLMRTDEKYELFWAKEF